LTSELRTASNIKDKHVRKAVISVLKTLDANLEKNVENKHITPKNGLVLLGGEINETILCF
jgi:peptide subunit release factor 1 (eRF1)